MKKRILSLLMCLCLSASLLPTTALAATQTWNYGATVNNNDRDNSVTATLADDGTLTITGNGNMWDLPVPTSSSSSSTGIDSNTAPWYADGSAKVKAVVVQSGITHIGVRAFRSLENLESVTLPEGLLTIGANAFESCPKLTEITIPNSVTTIGESAFFNCHGLALVKGGAGVQTIEKSAFEGVSSHENVPFPLLVPNAFFDKLLEAERVFSTLLGYEDNTDGVTITKVHVNGSLENVVIPGTVDVKNVTAIGANAFVNAGASQWAIKSVSLPDSVTSIGDNAFKGCNSMETIQLPSGLKTIGASAFEGCSQLTGVTLPSGLKTIGAKAFAECVNIDGLEIPDSVNTIGDDAFKGYGNGMFIVPDNLKDRMVCTNDYSEGKTYPNMIAYSVGDSDAVKLTKLVAQMGGQDTAITLPSTIGGKTVTDIGDNMCGGESSGASVNGVKTINLPNTVTSIGANAFAGCYDVESITGLDRVTTIGDNAFASTGLKSITLPSGLTSIGAGAFRSAPLTSVTIPKSVTTIGAGAFNCYNNTLKTLVNLGTCTDSEAVPQGNDLTVVWPDGNEHVYGAKAIFLYTREAAGSDNVAITGVNVSNDVTSAAFPANTGLNVTMVLMQQNGQDAITVTGITAPQLTWRQTYISENESGAEITKIVPVNGAKALLPETVKATIYNNQTPEVKQLSVVAVDEAYRQYADHGSRAHVYVEHGDGICQLCGEKADHTHTYEYVKDVDMHHQVCTQCKVENPESYGKHTYSNENVCTVCGFTKHVLNAVAYGEGSGRTKYLAGQTFELTNLRLECTYTLTNGTDPIVAWVSYQGEDDSRFSFEPTGALTADIQKVTVTFTEDNVAKTVEIPITVTADGKPVTGVTLDRTTAEMKVGEELTLTATVAPADATIKDVEWDSSNWGIASVHNGQITARKAGTVTITVTTVDGKETATCTITVKEDGTGGDTPVDPPSRPSGGSSSSTTTPDKPVTNPDGSTTTTTEDKTTGTVTETTKKPDGSQTVVETKKDGTVTTKDTDKDGNKTETVAKPDGSSVTKVEQTDGTTANVTTDTSGKVEAEVALPAAVVDEAQKTETPVALPIPEVKATASAETAPVVTVKTGSANPVKVEIPTADVTPGTVAVIVNADGSEEVIKTSVPTENGLTVALPDGATVKIVDNSKSFADVPTDSWAADAVNFSASRELFSGTGVDSFSPEEPMTRAMLMTVLARFDGADTSGGDTWYEKGMDWAVANGVSDGSAPDGNISREQLAVMLWRYSGSPAPSGSLDGFTDAGAVSGYAQEAMLWAVENGVVSGFGDGTLAPQGQATRAQVAQMMKNFITK